MPKSIKVAPTRVTAGGKDRAPFLRASSKLIVAALVLASASPLFALDRKVMTRVAPSYPEMAKRMHASGTVVISATVSPDGHVEKAKATAGHPLLCTAAEDAVMRWKFEKADESSVVSIQVVFAEH